MSDMKYLKVADGKWKGYTGALGMVQFVDGRSETMLPRHIRDRMAAAMPFIEIDADGSEQPAGAAHRMIREYAERAAPLTTLSRQSEGEKNAEIAESQIKLAKVPAVLTRAELEEIASKGGIKAVREVGKKWNVKHRAIPTLIEMILDAQEKAVAKTKPATPAAEPEPEPDEAVTIEPTVEESAVQAAAASGDLGAALSSDDTPQE